VRQQWLESVDEDGTASFEKEDKERHGKA